MGGQAQTSLKCAKEAVAIVQSLGNRRAEAECYSYVKDAYLVKKPQDTLRAGKAMLKAAKIYEALGDKKNQAWALHAMGTVEVQGKDLQKASTALNEAETLYHGLGDWEGECAVKATIMEVYTSMDMKKEAIETAKERVSIFNQVGERKL